LVLAPLPIVAIWFGGVLLAILTVAAAIVMAWEWGRLCGGGNADAAAPVLIAAITIAVVAASLWGLGLGVLLALTGALVVWQIAQHHRAPAPLWLAAGSLWVALPCIILLWLAKGDNAGGGLGDGYRRLCDRPPGRRPAARPEMEPAQDLGRSCGRRRLRRARRMGYGWGTWCNPGATPGAGQRRTCDC
jgi:hypothetical protein